MKVNELDRLLSELGFKERNIVYSQTKTNIMVCCPHGESNPSCGVWAEEEMFRCFSCGRAGSLALFVAWVLGKTIFDAEEWLKERKYSLRQRDVITSDVRRYEDVATDDRFRLEVQPFYKLAPFKSGKIFHKYILGRGFTKQTCKEFMLGWDSDLKRVTIPIFTHKGELHGFIGRAVLEEKNPDYTEVYGKSAKYKKYPGTKPSLVLFGIDKFVPEEDTAILVEGQLDLMWMFQNGFKNALGVSTSKISDAQISLLSKIGIKKVMLMFDNDRAGFEGMKSAYDKMRSEFILYRVEYPEGYNDPQTLNKEQIREMLDKKQPYGKIKLIRYS